MKTKTHQKRRNRKIILWSQSNHFVENIVAGFAALYPEFTWQIEAPPHTHGDYDTLWRELKAPWTAVSVFPVPYRTLRYMIQGNCVRILDSFLSIKKRNELAPPALELVSSQGHTYGVPEDIAPYALVVRNDLLKTRNMSPPKTWQDFSEQLKTWGKHQNKPVAGVAKGGLFGAMGFLQTLLGSNGVDPVSGLEKIFANENKIRSAYDWITECINRKNFLYPYTTSAKNQNPQRLFAQGELYYCFMWTGALSQFPNSIRQNIKALSFPKGPEAQESYTALHGTAWCIPERTIAPDIAFDLLGELTAPGLLAEREKQGGWAFPALKSLLQEHHILKDKPFYKDAGQVLEKIRGFTPNPHDLQQEQLVHSFNDALRAKQPFSKLLDQLQARPDKYNMLVTRNPTVQLVLKYIESELGNIQNVNQIAQAVRLHPFYLNRLFRQEINESCWAYVQRCRMQRSRELLANPSLTIKEIAVQLGFHSSSVFCRKFKKYWGQSATEIRQAGNIAGVG